MTNPSNTEIRNLAEKCLHTPAEPCREIDVYNDLLAVLTPQVIIQLLDQLKATQEALCDHVRVLSTLRDKHGVSADLIGDIFDEEQL